MSENLALRQEPPEPEFPQTLPVKKVSFRLGVGILLLPYIFSWFTLRAGHSIFARAIAFVWLAIAIARSEVGSVNF